MGNTASTVTDNNCKKGYLLKHELESKQLRRHYAVLMNHTLNLYEHELADNNPEIIDLRQFNDLEISSGESNRYQLKLSPNDTKSDLIFIASLDWVKYIQCIIPNHTASNDEFSNDHKRNDVDINHKTDQVSKINDNEEISRLKMQNETLEREKFDAILKAEEAEKKVMDKQKEIQLLNESLKRKECLNEDSKFEWRWQKNNEWTFSRKVTKRTNKLNIGKRINFIWPETESQFEIYRESLKTGHLRCISTNESWKIQRVDLRKEMKELKIRNHKLMKENELFQDLREEIKASKNMNDKLLKQNEEIKILKDMNDKLMRENKICKELKKKEIKELMNINDKLMTENKEMKELKNGMDELMKENEEMKGVKNMNDKLIKHIGDNSIWINGNYENIKRDRMIGYNLLFIRDKNLHSYRAMLDGGNNIAVLLNEEGIKDNLKQLHYPRFLIGEVFQIIQGIWPQTIGYIKKGDPVYIVTAGCLKKVKLDQYRRILAIDNKTQLEIENKREKKTEMGINKILLKNVSIINDGTYGSNEQRETGWIVRNISNKMINIKANLVRIDGDSDVEINYDKTIQLGMKPNDEIFILIQVKAPSVSNEYDIYFLLVPENDNKRKICDMLQLSVSVKKQFSEEKENKIKKIFEMGFTNRKKIIYSLQKWNWEEQRAVNWLATH